MGIYDRDYVKDSYQDSGGGTMYIGGGFRYISPIVKWLLIINTAVFILTISQNLKPLLFNWGAVCPKNMLWMIQIWRLITYQFLHENAKHYFFNMFFLFMFGPLLERTWGSRTFLKFYLFCGAIGGIVYNLLVLTHVLHYEFFIGPDGIMNACMVGASGALYGIMGALVILCPRMQVYVLGIFPMTILWLVILSIILSLLKFTSGVNAGGEAAHLSGLAAGAVYVLYKPWFTMSRLERKKGSWAKKIAQERKFEAEVDRILEKVNRLGIASLSEKEKQILQEATRREQIAQQR